VTVHRRESDSDYQPWFAKLEFPLMVVFYEVVIPGGGRDAGDHHSGLHELQAT
jgi:hypothetical protein